MHEKRVVLAYSGGLDTSVILKCLISEGFEVICFVGDVGQRSDFWAIEKRARACGALDVVVEDLREEFIRDFIFPALWAQAVYEGRYLLGTALARPVIARAQVRLARQRGAAYLSHGATAKGNDQVRFELAYHALDPDLKVLAPWKEPTFTTRFKGRLDLLAYAESEGIPLAGGAEKAFSEDDNLLHISHEAGILEDPASPAPEGAFSWCCHPQAAPDEGVDLELEFRDGEPVCLTSEACSEGIHDPLALITMLNDMASRHGIGRIDIVENRFVGVKSRGVYESPAATVLWAAHRDLECLAMDREVMRLRDMLSPKFAELIYNGFWFSPEVDFLLAAFRKSQEKVDGRVGLRLYKGNVIILHRSSPVSLYDQDLVSMDVSGGYCAEDARGFIRTHAMRLMAHHRVLRRTEPYAWCRGHV